LGGNYNGRLKSILILFTVAPLQRLLQAKRRVYTGSAGRKVADENVF
jgi:hypothetical protein